MIVLLTQERDDLFLPCNGLTIVCLLDLPRSVFVRMLCRMHQCFCGNATDIDTCPSVHLFRTLHYGNVQLPFCQLGSQCLSAFAESDDNDIILFHTSISLIGSILFCTVRQYDNGTGKNGRILDDQAPCPRQQRKAVLPASQVGHPHLRGCHQEREGTYVMTMASAAPASPIFGENIPRNVRMPMVIIRMPRP